MIFGREKEVLTLKQTLKKDASSFIAVYGRRRVGKTFLVNEAFDYQFTFKCAGSYKTKMKDQLRNFASSLKDAGLSSHPSVSDWHEAFDGLKEVIKRSNEEKKVVFLDELSWFASSGDEFLKALEFFWNSWASGRKDVVLVVCSSVASWIVNKIIHSKGGLYHRLTDQISLQPFSLKECKTFANANNLPFTDNDILEAYMIFGGVPYYWTRLDRRYSLAQNVDRLFVGESAIFNDEYDYIFSSLFHRPEDYRRVIEALCEKKMGVTRLAIAEAASLKNNGKLTLVLRDLESCGFIRQDRKLGCQKRESLYQIVDSFILFHHHFLTPYPQDEAFYSHLFASPKHRAWAGIAFERVCLLHANQIKKALGISGVYSEVSSLLLKKDDERGIAGSQMDLLIVRADRVISLCEMKYSDAPYTLSADFDADMRRKAGDLRAATNGKYGIHVVLVTPHGASDSAYQNGLNAVVTKEDLFAA